MKKKVALIIDVEDWSFDIIAKKLKQNIEDFDIDIIPGCIFEGNMVKLFIFCEDYDIIHFMWRGYISLLDRPAMIDYAKSLGMEFNFFVEKYVKNKHISFGVCDELYLEGEDEWRTEEIMKYSKKYFTTSKRLYDIYQKFSCKPDRIIHDGVDTKMFNTKTTEKFNNCETLIVGWVGNSNFKDSSGDDDLKGVKSIIKPAIKELQEEGYRVELKLADSTVNKISPDKMPDFYSNIHVYVCASKTEGTPLTVLEAMASGDAVISTNVGIVDEAFGQEEKRYLLTNRNKEELKDKIVSLINNKQELEKLSNENLEQIKKWDWAIIAKNYEEFFKSQLDEKGEA